MKKKVEEFEFMLFKSDKNIMMESKSRLFTTFSLQESNDKTSV